MKTKEEINKQIEALRAELQQVEEAQLIENKINDLTQKVDKIMDVLNKKAEEPVKENLKI